MRADRAGGFKGGLTDKERELGQRGNQPRDWTKGKDFPGSALNFLGSHSESCWFACVYDNPFQLTFWIVPNYLLWEIKKKRSGWGGGIW